MNAEHRCTCCDKPLTERDEVACAEHLTEARAKGERLASEALSRELEAAHRDAANAIRDQVTLLQKYVEATERLATHRSLLDEAAEVLRDALADTRGVFFTRRVEAVLGAIARVRAGGQGT